MLIYLKPTNMCNLNCEHCYVPETKRTGKDNTYESNVNKQKMTLEDIDRIYEKILAYSWDIPPKILFHGGEATLMGIDFYEYILKHYGHLISHFLQTNLLLYSAKWDHIIEKLFSSGVGTSFDFTRRLNGSFERFRDVWMKNYLEVKNKFGVSLRMVVTKTFVEKGANYWYDFINELKPNSYGFEYYLNTPENNPSIAISYTDYLRFLMEFCQLIVNKGEIPNFYPIKEVVSVNTGKSFFYGGYFTGDCMKNHIVIDPDGSIGTCPSLAANDLKIGNIFDQDLYSILNGRERIQYIIRARNTNCGDCKYSFGICGGGCYAMRFYNNTSCGASLKDFTNKKCIELFEYLENLAKNQIVEAV